MPRKKKKRICAQCGKTITRTIKRVQKDVLLFCTPEHAIAYHSAGNQVKVEKKKEQVSQQQPTTLMNVKDIRRTNPTWYNDPLFVYIGRKMRFLPMKQSIFRNPYRALGRRKGINKFETQFYRKLKSDSTFKQAVEKLRGKILVCWCAPASCHGDVIINYLYKPKTLMDYKEKIKKVPQDIDVAKTDLIFNLIRLYEVQQDQFTFQDRLNNVEGATSWYIMPDYLAKQSGYPMALVRGCLLSLNHLQHKIYWNEELFIESKDHYIQRNFMDYKGRTVVTRQRQSLIYRLFGGRPQEVTDREIIRSR